MAGLFALCPIAFPAKSRRKPGIIWPCMILPPVHLSTLTEHMIWMINVVIWSIN